MYLLEYTKENQGKFVHLQYLCKYIPYINHSAREEWVYLHEKPAMVAQFNAHAIGDKVVGSIPVGTGDIVS